MAEEREQKKTSKFMMLIYLILGIVLLTFILEATGMADVAGKRETEEIIDHPHQR
ncbi:MAG: hypothetical protein AAGA31_04115 [Bacteroidota bacterium]